MPPYTNDFVYGGYTFNLKITYELQIVREKVCIFAIEK